MTQPSRKATFLIVASAFGLYLLFSLSYLHLPGLECDEVIFVNGALGNLDGTFLAWHHRIGRFDIPLMIMRYIGAVKSYLYAPVFALFGTNPTTVRLPVVLLGLVSLALTYATAREMLGRKVALLSLALFATDPSFIFANRLDWGPNSVMMVLKCAAIYLLWRWLRDGKPWQMISAALLLGIGLFDKVVFAWFIGATVLAFPVCFWPRIKPRLNRHVVALALAAFLAGSAPLIAYNIRYPLLTFEGQKPVVHSLAYEMAYRYRLFRNTLRGSEVLIMMNQQEPEELVRTYHQPAAGMPDTIFTAVLRVFPVWRSFTAIALVLSLVLIGVLAARSRLRRRAQVGLILLILLLTGLFIFITPQAVGTHHVMMVYPFPHILIAFCACEANRLVRIHGSGLGRAAARAGMSGVLALVLLSPVIVDMGHIKAFKARGGFGRWSDAIYQLADYIESRPDKHFLFMDWGFSPQLLVLRKGKLHWEEAFPRVLDTPSMAEKIEATRSFLINPDDLFVFHMPPFETYPIMKAFQASLRHYGLEYRNIDQLPQRDGQPIYLLCQALHPALEMHRRLGNYFYFREAEDYDACSIDGVDFKSPASRGRSLGNFWGSVAGDFAVYRWQTPREIDDGILVVRYSSDAAAAARIDVTIDGKLLGTLVTEPTGGFGLKEDEWRMTRLGLGKIPPGRHELRFQPRVPGRPVNMDYFYLSEHDFDYLPPTPALPSSNDAAANPSLQAVQGFQTRPEVRVELNASEFVAGESTLSLHVSNLTASAIDVLYSLDGKYMPIVHGWRLNKDHTATVFIDSNTPKGRYVYEAIRDSSDPSSVGWIRVNIPVLIN